MKIVISGGSGFIGSNLTSYFCNKVNLVVPLTSVHFNGDVPSDELKSALYGADVVINLAGVSINHRWTRSYREKMYESRISTTRKIVEVLNSQERKPQLFISASAVGYYPTQGCFDEQSSAKGKGFLANLCESWEQEARKISPEVRLAITRFGVVLAKKGGAFPLLKLPARFKVVTVIGPGSQLLPWIYINDLVSAMDHIINTSAISGMVNFVAPQLTTNRDMMKAIGKREKSWLSLTIPKFFFWLALGEASTFITKGQCVRPVRLMDSEFNFSASTVEKLLDNLYRKD